MKRFFAELAGKGLYGCIWVVGANRQKWGLFRETWCGRTRSNVL